MKSTCPLCLSQVEHADGASQITCSCGHAFSPYLEAVEALEAPSSDFSESTAAFADIRAFGEDLNHQPTSTANESLDVEKELEKVLEEEAGISVPPSEISSLTDTPRLITTTEEIQGFRITEYFLPVSTWFDAAPDDPLAPGLQSLWQMATALGASAVVGVRFILSSNAQRGIVFGTPVRTEAL